MNFMNFRIFLFCFVSASFFVFSCREAPIPNREANEYGKDSIIVLKEFSDNTNYDESKFNRLMRVREDSSGYAIIYKNENCNVNDSSAILGKIRCGTFIHG